tara:strand:- start:391 stop:921 length:531 start_codon:yes stop_codon:yes gene_type:complete
MIIDEQLMEQWEPKVQKIVSNTYVVGLDRDDIAQELRIALIKAARGFEEDRGILFHTYLHTAMINTVRSLISKAQRQLLTESFDRTYETEAGETLPQTSEIQLALADIDEFTHDVEIEELLVGSNLTAEEAQFVALRLEGLTMEEITEDLQESAYKLRQGVREKLQGVLYGEAEAS